MTKNSPALLYRTLWRWHFYAGLFCLPFIVTLAVSGTIYLFKPQVDAWIDAPYRNLPITGPRSSANDQIAAALAAHPGSAFVNYRLPQSVEDAVIITLQQADGNYRVYVHPTSLEILRSTPTDGEFMQLVKRFHGELLAGNIGSVIIELAGCWAIVLVITGLYLWWPRNARGAAGVIYPRLNQGSRVFWRDLHAVTGIWVSAFTLFLLISGLPWALVWGSALKELRHQASHYSLASGQPHHHNSENTHPEHDHHPMAQDWQIRGAAKSPAHGTVVNLPDILVANAQRLNFAAPVELAPAADLAGSWSVKSQTQNRPLRAEAWLDNTTGEVIRTQYFSEKKTLDRIIGVGIAAHEGQLFGWLNQLLGVFTTAGLTLMSVSAFVLWRRRKPANSLGAPPALPEAKVGRTVAAIILLLALLLPLLAASVILILLIEWLVLQRLQGARRWLGLSTE